MLERRKQIELYNCVGSKILGLYVGVLLGPEGETVDSLGNYNHVRGTVSLDVIFNKIWGSGVK